jgi:tetratricopeptide (TPR) repeat protein
MRFLDSGTLEEIMEQGLLPHDEIAYVMRQVCSALDYAHRQGIVHRDIKPSNIMIDQQGNAFVADLGIARIAAEAGGRQITATGAIIGTPDYMSPEQARGRDDVDARADIYALGAMLYQMLTGEVPYAADTPMNVLMKHIHDPIPSLREKNPSVPLAAEAVVHKAMAKDRAQRYASAVDLSQAISDALGGTVTADPTRLREAAGTSIIRRSGGHRKTTGGTTPSEQNRQVTALYANAAEYVALVDQVAGSEAARRAMAALHEAIDGVIATFHGRVLTSSDNDHLALWGAEAATEVDAERAVRAALGMHEALRSLGAAFLGDGEEALPLSIGIHSGVALLTPSDRPGSISASGSTISLANRLMQNAAGLVLITHDTYRQVRGVFDVQPDLPVRMRGRSEPIETYRVLALKPHAFRFNTRGVEGVETRMVGREAELKHLQNAFLDAFEDGETHVVTITGEAGVGKSRLLYEYAEWGELRPERYFVFRGRATPEARGRPYALLRDTLAFRFGLQDDDSRERTQEKFEQGLAELSVADPLAAHLLGSLCGYDLSSSPLLRPLLADPEQLALQARRAAVGFFVALARNGNVSLQLEDLHHADDASLDLLNDLFVADPHLHLLAVCVARPGLFERRPDWGSGQAWHTRIGLKPLDKRESRSLVQEILKKVDEIPRTIRDLLVERAEGNPYYLEELVRMLIDDHVIVRESDERWRVEEARLGALEVPPTLYGLLEARVDTLLFPEKLTLQRASVFGRIFYDKVLSAMDELDDVHVADLPGVLQSLSKREFVFKREASALADSQEFIFGQAMLRDTIYERLLDRQRRTYHRAAADWLAGLERASEYLPQTAEHYILAGADGEAIETLRRAGDRASLWGLAREAVDHYERALALLPEGKDEALRLDLLLSLGDIAQARGDFPKAQPALQAALDLSGMLKLPADQAKALSLLSQVETSQGNYAQALSHLDEALPLARPSGDLAALANVLYGMANAHFRVGNATEGIPCAQECIELARQLGDDTLLLQAENRLGTLFEHGGDFEGGRREFESALDLARRVGHRRMENTLLTNLGYLEIREGNYERAVATLERAMAWARESDDLQGLIFNGVNLAIARLRVGGYDQVLPLIKETLLASRRADSLPAKASAVGVAGELRLAQGDVSQGLALLGLAKNHPAASTDIQADIALALLFWGTRLSLEDRQIEAGLAAGKSLDLETEVEKILTSDR